ncbi:MOFRL domain protein [Fulvimarina pelagi HTCC2506]|uniref:MOFRL domain protein n=1 Tax=Fulvimarina pelagi HTCC2506 TaxID=314231 RepID=Q0G2B9_9HYPH|nr:DUF4147 domain-containing protein [Fulvimarina pelagi]EAU41279.1 MOFRL domain protein [Fulvimarina pelagi HTCC2506]
MSETQDQGPDPSLRADAEAIFQRAVEAADPANAVEAALRDRHAQILDAKAIVLIAFGKAATQMAEAALPYVQDKLKAGVAVTTQDAAKVIAGVDTYVGGHPTPTEGSEKGAEAIEAAADSAEEGDLVLVLVSGGGSALLTAPAEGLTLEDKIAVNDALLGCGAPIDEINTVRRKLSRLKGGGLLKRAAPARVLSLILSDVPGDDPKSVASGPSVPPADMPEAALDIVQRYGIEDRIPEAALARLRGTSEDQDFSSQEFETVIVGSNSLSCDAAEAAAEELGYVTDRVDGWLDGDVADAAQRLRELLRNHSSGGKPIAIIAGGETTVVLRGGGTGGRNQEMAMRFAMLAEAEPISGDWVFLSGGTDGRDGPTNAAGAIVDRETLDRMRQSGLDPEAKLADNDSNPALEAADALVKTGATGTNVADVQVILLR